MKEILSGNEAIARGAYEAGCLVACGYPGTPSTEILENTVKYAAINSSWASNEKVALEVAIGASFAGGRALCTMKHVGVNVAADPLFTLSYTGVNAGLVLIAADDPGMHSSQNEQDSRNYGKAAKIPMLEPADSQECKDFACIAFEMSEKYDTPMILRTCTRLSHSKSIVELGERNSLLPQPKLVKNAPKLVMLPGNARVRHPLVERRMIELSEVGATMPINRMEIRDKKIGIITAGVCFNYLREVLPKASTLKLGMVYPLPYTLIRQFADQVDQLFVIEELDPFIEDQIKAMGICVKGKELFSLCGEITPKIIRDAFLNLGFLSQMPPDSKPTAEEIKLPSRPPNMCPGCPHRGVFYTLNKLKAYVTGDIGCYTLGFMPPLSAMDTCICMGASIGMATGVTKVVSDEEKKKVVAVIGDSTFLHTGINGLMDMVYNQSPATVIILDNRITAMTGRQDNPASGFTLMDSPTNAIDFPLLCKSIGVKNIRVINPFDLEETERVLQEEMHRNETSVIITNKPCVLIKREGIFKKGLVCNIDEEKCVGCRACLKIGCPAIEWQPTSDGSKKGKALIDEQLCTGCDVCRQLCRFEAIGDSN